MSETPTPALVPQRSVAAQIRRGIICSFGVIFFFLLMTGGLGLLEVPFILITGWIQFLARTTPNITWNWDLVGMGVISTAMILVLTHWFLSWILKSIASARGTEWEWPWKWTWCGLFGMALLFLVGMATGGVAHQIGWITSSPEPWHAPKRGHSYYDHVGKMENLQVAFRVALDNSNDNIENARRELWNPQNGYRTPSLLQAYHLLMVNGDDGKLTGIIIFPRNGEQRKAAGGAYFRDDVIMEQIPFAKLQELIQTNRTHLQAL